MGLTIQTLAEKINAHAVVDKKVVKADFARATTVTLDQYCKKVTKVKGEYIGLHSLMTHVVQGFKSEWQELGEYEVRKKSLKNYRQKVNFKIKPDDIMGTILSDWYEEDKPIESKEIVKKVINFLFDQVIDDLEYLSILGVYDEDKSSGNFGYSINGLNNIIKIALEDTNNPVFKIPVNVITDNNIIDVFTAFEKNLPENFKNKIKTIHTSSSNIDRYSIAYFNKYGHYPTFKDTDSLKSPLKRYKLIGHDGLEDDIIFATSEGNLLNLIDVVDNPPAFTRVFPDLYDVKIIMEFWKGYDFLINQAVCVANFTDNARGLGDDKQMTLYYPNERKIAPITP